MSMNFKTTPHVSYFSRNNGRPGYSNAGVLPKFRGTMYPFWFQNARITWYPNPAWENPRYNIYRSESPEGPWTKLNATPFTSTVYNDFGTNQMTKYAHDLYVVEVIQHGQVLGRSSIIKNEKLLPTWHNLRAVEINRREWLMLTRFMGIPCLVMKHVNYGKYQFRCKNCWDPVNLVVRDDYCTECYGTSYEMGYYPGIRTYFQFTEPNKQDVVTEEGRMEPSDTQAWTIAYPELDVNDLILRLDDYRVFRIDNVQNTSLMSVTIRQVVGVTHLPPNTVEYKLFEREGVLVP